MKFDAPGLYSDVPMDIYLQDPIIFPSLSSSIALKILQESPLHGWAHHARNPDRIPREETKVESIGTIAHAMLLEGSEEKMCEINPDDHRGKRGGIPDGWTNDAIRAARDEALANGLVPMLPKHAEICRGMLNAAKKYIATSQIADVFSRGECEVTAVAQEGPIWLRARPDWLTHDRKVCVHFKTTARSAKPSVFGRGLLRNMGYDFVLAFYQRVIAGANGGVAPLTNCILAQEQEPPHACSLIALTDEYEDLASRMVRTTIDTWAECMRTNRWPGYSGRIEYIKPPPWMELQMDEEEARQTFIGGQQDLEQEKYGLQM